MEGSMAIKGLMSSQIEAILAAGGGVTVDGSKFMATQLQAMAAAARQGGAQLVIRPVGLLMSSQLETIAASGRGHVRFED
jgi:alcohol dehydrogenase YqhD (iron-dependent ADH family)